VRQVQQAGGNVEVTRSGHARWTMPDGTELRTGISMNGARTRNAHRDITRALAVALLERGTSIDQNPCALTTEPGVHGEERCER
jgi:hypothetical protein